MTYKHKAFGSLEVTERDDGGEDYVLNGQAVTSDDALHWMRGVARWEEWRNDLRWDNLQRKHFQSVSWLRHPIVRWKLERIYRRYQPASLDPPELPS